jgi:predicted RNA-binding protein YlqC (UPF0109 family)
VDIITTRVAEAVEFILQALLEQAEAVAVVTERSLERQLLAHLILAEVAALLVITQALAQQAAQA